MVRFWPKAAITTSHTPTNCWLLGEHRMKDTNWKDVAELIGIAAIVASLIFVGLQMK